MRPASQYSYDEECEKLAAHFLKGEGDTDTPVNRQELAQAIQDAVDDWFVMVNTEEMK